MRLFFFGTLMDDEVRRAVVGRAIAVAPAWASGFRRVFVAGRDYPMLLRRAGGRVDGVLTGALETAAIRRLDAYEGREYRLGPIRAECGGELVAAFAYFCRPGVVAGDRDWRFEDWEQLDRPTVLRRIAGLMRLAPRGRVPPSAPLTGVLPMADATSDVLSPGNIAKELGVSDGKVKKAIKDLGLEPAAKKGVCCFYSRDAIAKIKASVGA